MKTVRIRVAGILIKDGKILLVRHKKINESYWLLPGGGIEFGESTENALIREFKEEVGIEVEIGKLVFVHDSIPRQLFRHGLNLYFLVTAKNHEVKVTRDSVLMDASFVSLEEFKNLSLRPDLKNEILNGLNENWATEPMYLGNLWKD